MFKTKFKYFKNRNPPPQFESVYHPEYNNTAEKFTPVKPTTPSYDYDCQQLGLFDVNQWKIYELVGNPGLIFIVNPFTRSGQRHWVQRCLQDYTKKPNSRLNIDPFGELLPGQQWWEIAQSDSPRGQIMLSKLRWATLGYHHNWDTKEYSEDARDQFPADLAELSRLIISAIGDSAASTYDAQAAIVNFYHLDSTLSGHRDVSEHNMNAPLISISFGQSAVFLLGGASLDDPVTAMFLHSGDVMIMTGSVRICYHGVPRVVTVESLSLERPWSGEGWENTPCGKYLETNRININVRQVLVPGQLTLT